MKYNTATLDNGLRAIHCPSASPVVYCGYEVCAGTRDEKEGEEGMAHFCEHTTFKGTRHRSAMQILNRLESVGGDLNAFTNKEDTVYYSAILKNHFPRAVDLLTDIVFGSTHLLATLEQSIDQLLHLGNAARLVVGNGIVELFEAELHVMEIRNGLVLLSPHLP